MPLITDDVAGQLKQEFAQVKNPVRLAVFSQALADPDSEQVKRLVEELAAVESRISVLSYNFVLDKAKVEALRIQRTPAIAILGAEKGYGIRMYGLTSGYEFVGAGPETMLLKHVQDAAAAAGAGLVV